MRKLVIVGAAVVALAAVPAAAAASSPSSSSSSSSGSSGINCQQLVWRTASVSTSSSGYANVPGLAADVGSIDAMSITVSAVLTGGPVALRVTDTSAAGTLTVPPGHVSVAPAPGRTAFSFSWTDPGLGAAIHGHEIRLQWRATGTTAVTLGRGDITVGYETTPGSCPLN